MISDQNERFLLLHFVLISSKAVLQVRFFVSSSVAAEKDQLLNLWRQHEPTLDLASVAPKLSPLITFGGSNSIGEACLSFFF